MRWELPPRIKIYEALGVLGDGRMHVDGNTAKVYSSSGNKFYTVTYEPETGAIAANDNGSYWKGYLGYPAIAYLMYVGKLSYSKEAATALSGIAWKDINTKFKNDFGKTLDSIHASLREKGVDVEGLEREVDELFEELKQKLPEKLGRRMQPPEGY